MTGSADRTGHPGSAGRAEPATAGALTLVPLHGMGEVERGADLGALVLAALAAQDLALQDGDVLVVSSKVVSKSLGLREQTPDRDHVVLQQSRRIVAERRGPAGTTRVVESAAGPVVAAAGVDASNTGPGAGLLLLPTDPDLAARSVYAALLTAHAPAPLPLIGVVLSDTAGRPWREGQTDFALGACGVAVLDDLRGGVDVDGRALSVTARALADEIAAAADLVKGKTLGVPVALLRGLPEGTVGSPGLPGASGLVRTGPGDWFAFGAAEAVRAALGAPPGSPEAEAVGIASVLPEDDEVRLARAIRLALLDVAGEARAEPRAEPGEANRSYVTFRGGELSVRAARAESGALHLEVHTSDPFLAGRVSARLEVALHSEALGGLRVRVHH